MKNLFKYAASYWKAMIAIVLILVVQAYCDLSLPAYTSDIVNVGIQQGGIEDEVPRQIATEEMEKLLLFVSEDDQQTVMDAYTEDNTSYKKEAYVLKDSVAEEENTMENLKDILHDVEKKALVSLDGQVDFKLTNKIKDGKLYVDQGIIAGCAGGGFENICAAADIIRGKYIGSDEFTFSVYPASTPIYMELVKNGAVADLMEAGHV